MKHTLKRECGSRIFKYFVIVTCESTGSFVKENLFHFNVFYFIRALFRIVIRRNVDEVCCHANVSVYLLLMFSVCVSVFQKISLRFSLHGLRKPGMISTGEI